MPWGFLNITVKGMHLKSVFKLFSAVSSLVLMVLLSGCFWDKDPVAAVHQTSLNAHIPGYHRIYSTVNLDGMTVNTEPNPGGTTNGPFSLDPLDDAKLDIFPDHGELTANYALNLSWINALAGMKFIERFPDGNNLFLTRFKYSGYFRTPVLSSPNPAQVDNGQSVQALILLYDGRNALWKADNFAIEACFSWRLNAWNLAEYGKIQIFTTNLALVDSGITLPHDTQWHYFEMIVDVERKMWVSIRIDDQLADVSSVPLSLVDRSAWKGDTGISLLITVESCPVYPNNPILLPFRWNTHFRDLEFSYFF